MRVLELAAKHRLPGIYESRLYVEAGGHLSYNVSAADLFRCMCSFHFTHACFCHDRVFPVSKIPTYLS